MFVTTKHVFCRDKSMLVATTLCLSRQNVCRNKYLSRQTRLFVKTIPLSQENYVCRDKHLSWHKFCHDKHDFVATKDVFCRDKHVFVVTKVLSWQKWDLWQLPPMVVTGSPCFRLGIYKWSTDTVIGFCCSVIARTLGCIIVILPLIIIIIIVIVIVTECVVCVTSGYDPSAFLSCPFSFLIE